MTRRTHALAMAFAVVTLSVAGPAAGADVRLVEAARHGDAAAVRALIAERHPVNAPEPDGTTALHEAVRRNRLDIVDLLLSAGAEVNVTTRYNITPIALACTNGSAAMVERLLAGGADANAVSHEGQTALMTAALTGNVATVDVLITHGAKVDVAEPLKGQTALMWAAAEGNTAAAVALVAAGADVHATSKAGFTPLLFAVRGGHTDAVRALVTRGANVNDVAPDGTSALNMAVVNGYYEVAALLAEQHADPNLPDARGSALHTLAWHRRPGSDGGTGLGRRSYGPPVQTGDVTALELARLLLEHGANPNATIRLPSDRIPREGNMPNPPLITMGRHIITYDGATPFYVAARNGDPAYMRLLAEHGADPKRPNAAGVTPLIAAAGLDTWEGEVPGPFAGTPEAERLEAVTLALSLGNDINAATAFGDYTIEGDPQYTLIYPPANFNELSAIVKGGDPRWGGCTALHASIIANQPSITQFLVDNGATLDVKNRAGWTPLMMSRGIFLANGSREYPAAEAILIRAMTARGLPIPPAPPRATTAEAAGGR